MSLRRVGKVGKGSGGGFTPPQLDFRRILKIPKSRVGKGRPYLIIKGSYPAYVDIDGNYIENPEDRPLVEAYTVKMHRRRAVLPNGKSIFKEEACSRGWDPDNPQPCGACEENKQILESNPNEKKIYDPSMTYYFSAIDLGYWHKSPVISKKTGEQIKHNSGDLQGQPMFTWTECSGKKCELCKQGVERVFGRRGIIRVGQGHLSNIIQIEQDLKSRCSCGGELEVVAVKCSKCGTEYDINIETDEDLEELLFNPLNCKECGYSELPVEIFECTDCDKPRPVNLYKHVVWLRKTGEGTDSKIDLGGHMTVKEFAEKFLPGPDEGGYSSIKELVKDLYVPIDFEKIFKPRDLETQIKYLGLKLNKESLVSMNSDEIESDEEDGKYKDIPF